MAVINKNGTYMALPSAIKRGSATALDTTSVWYDRALMEFYAQGGGKLGEVDVPITAYVGQVLTLVDETNNTATAYLIVDEAGHLNEVGSATLGDNASIELVDGVLSVKDFGKQYYKYVAAVEGGEAAHYELTEGWVAGLEPRVVEVDGEMVIGWYEPNPTTAEGVKDQVVEVQGEVEQVKDDVKGLEDILNGTEEAPGLIEEVGDIADALYGTEGENPVPGLIEQVETLDGEIDAVAKDLADNYYKKSETYTKTEVDGLVSGVFHFEGVKDSYDALPVEGNTKGDVYQVGDKEYAWNGTEWVELGFVVDLSGYYTKTEVDAEVKEVQDALDLVEEDVAELVDADTAINERIDGLEQAHETINGAIDAVEEDVAELVAEDERLAGLINGHEDRIADLETAKTGFDTHFETVDGKIEALEQADNSFETRIGTLETNVGTPSENFKTALFPAVETLQGRIDGLVAVGGEANLINGLTINGTALVPNAERIVDLPVFAGSTAGLVPIVNGLDNTYYLNAAGEWSVPQDSRIGDLGDYATVVDYIDNKFTWSSISD
jgi:prefoldin subunit 5